MFLSQKPSSENGQFSVVVLRLAWLLNYRWMLLARMDHRAVWGEHTRFDIVSRCGPDIALKFVGLSIFRETPFGIGPFPSGVVRA